VNLLRASATIGAFTLGSRVTGFVRDMLMANFLGAGLAADAFFVAFKLPNLFRRLFAEGAFSAGFVPIFSNLLTKEGQAAAQEFTEQALSVLAVALLLLLALFEVAMPLFMYVLAPGFAADPAKFDLTVALTRITFPYLLCVSLVSLMGGVLNSLGKFTAQAAAPVLLNLALIGVLIVFRDYVAGNPHVLAWGVFAAGFLQLAGMTIACWRAGFRLKLRRPRLTPRVRELARLMGPAVVGSGAAQISIAVDIIIASLLPTGAVSYLFYADRLVQLPLGVVGVAVGTALLPLLSRQVGAGDDRGALHSLNRGIELVLLLTVPAAVALALCADPIIQVLFERGAFTREATHATAAALVAFAVGLPAYVLVKVLAPPFFARKDTRTPVVVSVAALALNIVLNLILMVPLRHVGLALATALSAWVNAGALALILHRRGQVVLDAQLRGSLWRGALAVVAMAAALAVAVRGFAPLFQGSLWEQGVAVACLVAAGGTVYGLGLQFLGVATVAGLRQLARGR
jgi:putative peptidoglycan lipid II flippase